MLRTVRKLVEFSLSEWLLLAQLLLGSLVAGVAIRWIELPRLIGLIIRGTKSRWLRRLPLLHDRHEVARLTILADLAAMVIHGQHRCLVRSLLLFWLLKTRHEPADMFIGINKEATSLYGHAWIETQGMVIGDTAEMTRRFATVLHF